MKSYNNLDSYFKYRFGEKIGKVSIDGGFSCPNREHGRQGCLFCSDEGAGEFAGDRIKPIEEQIESQKAILNRKWKLKGYMAYFQNFTNTYAEVSELKSKYEQALSADGVIGIAIATRPDCLNEQIINLLSEINKKTFLWVELGFQTSNQKTAELINRGYDNNVFDTAISDLKAKKILTVVHLIAGLPGETKQDFLNSIRYLNHFKIWGIKIHSLYIQTNSPLYDFYLQHHFPLLTENQYIDIVCDSLEILDGDIIIHRLTGDGKKEVLFVPTWILNKLKVLSAIELEMKRRHSFQGINYQI